MCIHQLSTDIELATHVQDVVAVLEYEDLHDVILVGHSYGGMVVAGVAAQAASRVAKLVYLDAFLPEDGKSVKDYAELPPVRLYGWRVAPAATARQFGVTNAQDAAWGDRRLSDQPLKTFHAAHKAVGERFVTVAADIHPVHGDSLVLGGGRTSEAAGFRYRTLL